MVEHSTQPFRWGSCQVPRSACLQMDGVQKLLPACKDGSKVKDPWNQCQGWKNSPQQQRGEFTATSTTQQYLKERWEGKYATYFATFSKATYFGAVAGGLTLKKSEMQDTDPTVNYFPKWAIYKFHNKPHFVEIQVATQRITSPLTLLHIQL